MPLIQAHSQEEKATYSRMLAEAIQVEQSQVGSMSYLKSDLFIARVRN